jgi:hypothetical protein
VVNLLETNPNHEHATTGTGTIEYACHDMKRPNAVGDLQKGERQAILLYLEHKMLKSSV